MLKNNVVIQKITSKDIEKCVDILYDSFKDFVNTKEELEKKIHIRLNNDISICLKVNEEIIGVYLLTEHSINHFIQSINENKISDFNKKDTDISLNECLSDNGLQGIALSIHHKHRGKGYGTLLKKYTYKLGYDYIWGVQNKNLKNIDHWLKTRKLFAVSPLCYATYLRT